jgi:steroid 5-alpha reductase family enzyme
MVAPGSETGEGATGEGATGGGSHEVTGRLGPRREFTRRASLGLVLAAYVSAMAVAVVAAFVVGTGRPLLTVAVADLAATLVIFVWSRSLNNSSMYDAYWSVVPPVVALFLLWVAQPGAVEVRQLVVVALVWFWAIRLTVNWARGWPGLRHEDWRYVDMRSGSAPYWVASLFGLHLMPTVVVYLAMLPLYPALVSGTRAFGWLDVVAVVVTGGAVVLEWVADEQMRAFGRTKSPGDVCRRGVWAWSRHPNYLGEMGFWWGLWLFAMAAQPSWWWTVVGPVVMTVMFLGASLPLMERRSLERRPGYAAYAAETPLVIPRPPRTRRG